MPEVISTMTPLSYTYSPKQAASLGLDPHAAFLELLQLPITQIRLCCYWSEIQPSQSVIQLEEVYWYLQQCEQHQKKVTLAIGVKSPRWPEFHRPAWVSEDLQKIKLPLLDYLKTMVTTLAHFHCIESWQIENEPFDQSGPNKQVIPVNLFENEVKTVRSLDGRKIIGTVWGNDLIMRNALLTIEPLVDEIGLDFYPKQATNLPMPLPQYRGIMGSTSQLNGRISRSTKPFFISEMQAEPWEPSTELFLSEQPTSFNPDLLVKNLEWAEQLQINRICLWGVEYWIYARQRYADNYFECITKYY